MWIKWIAFQSLHLLKFYIHRFGIVIVDVSSYSFMSEQYWIRYTWWLWNRFSLFLPSSSSVFLLCRGIYRMFNANKRFVMVVVFNKCWNFFSSTLFHSHLILNFSVLYCLFYSPLRFVKKKKLIYIRTHAGRHLMVFLCIFICVCVN